MLANKYLQILLLFTITSLKWGRSKKNNKKMNQVLQYIKSNQVTFIYIVLYTILIVSKQLYRVKQENSWSIMLESFFQLKSVHWWFSVDIIQFSSLPIMSVQSAKRPQISKPKAKAARTQNSIGDRNWVENLWSKQEQSGGSSPLARLATAWRGLILGCNTGQIEQRTCLVLMVLTDGVFRGDLSLELI